MQHASAIEPAILTPSTKAEEGHDLPISFEQTVDLVGLELAEKARDAALALYRTGRDFARERGIIIADTKFEFGLRDGGLVLIDECLTADSSRFWPVDEVCARWPADVVRQAGAARLVVRTSTGTSSRRHHPCPMKSSRRPPPPTRRSTAD